MKLIASGKFDQMIRFGIQRMGIRKTSPSAFSDVDTIQASGTIKTKAPTRISSVLIHSRILLRMLLRFHQRDWSFTDGREEDLDVVALCIMTS